MTIEHPTQSTTVGIPPAGVNHIPSSDIRSVGRFLLDGAERWPHQPWCITPDGEVSRAQALDGASRVAAALYEAGVRTGDRIVVGLPNSLDFVFAWFGALLAGIVPVAMNPKALESELTAVAAEVGARLAIVSTTGADSLASLHPGLRVQTVPPLLERAPLDVIDTASDIEAPASFLQSSGSTGRPKLIALSHRAQVLTAEAFPSWLELTDADVLLTVLPLAHANAQLYSLLGSYGLGARLVLLPRFSATTFWRDVNAYGVTEFNAMSAMLEILRRRPIDPAEQSHKVRRCFTGPAFASEDHRDIERRFNLTLVVTYGQTEILMAGLTTPAAGTTNYGSSGRPRQHPVHGTVNAARILDPTGRELQAGQTGELEIWSASPTPGYLNMPQETAQLFRDGWVRTGDLAHRDDNGYFYITGRIKEMIRYRGENLSPAEVESILLAHPAVSAVAVVGVPSDFSDEDIKAFTILHAGHDIQPAALFQWCSERLPSYKVPRYLEFVGDFPLTDTNKIAKNKLSRARTAEEFDRLAAADGDA